VIRRPAAVSLALFFFEVFFGGGQGLVVGDRDIPECQKTLRFITSFLTFLSVIMKLSVHKRQMPYN
jgi:hypothetical protein